MTTVADYQGRSVDVLGFRGKFEAFSRKSELLEQTLALPEDGGAIVAGVQKLAQRTLLVLLTKLGSRLYAPLEGTSFMLDAQHGVWRTSADVELSFHSARVDVARQIQASETDNDPDDERWGSLDLDGLTLAGDQVRLQLTLMSRAGTTYKYLMPITVALQ